MRLRLSSDFAIDTDAYKREGLRISILAMSGHGKSNAAADLVEDVLDNHAQVIIIEPIPEWHTLKARYNNVVVIGGPYQDLPLEAGFAHEYVKAALEKGISLVVNVSDIEEDADQIKFVSNFLWNLYRLEQKYRRVIFLVLEEADTWAPQMWDATTKQSLSRVSLIAKHGRKIGIFPILISQRPADLHKSPLSQCNINLFGKFTSPADLNTKTGIMYVVKKLHISISEKEIMELSTGSFIVSDKSGVHTVAARKRVCPHGADTPLIEAKPFTTDLSNALGNLRDEIVKALAVKKEEQSEIKRLLKESDQLKVQVRDLEQKANIKLSLTEMLSQDKKAGAPPPGFEPGTSKESKERKEFLAELEEFRSGRKLAESVSKRLEGLGGMIVAKDDKIMALERELKGTNAFRETLLKLLFPDGLPTQQPMALPSDRQVGLQSTTTIIDVAAAEKFVTINTETIPGKILFVAKKGKLNSWTRLGDIVNAIKEERWVVTSQQVNNALNDMVKDGLIAKKHTGRNYFCLAQGVIFAKEEK